MRKSRDQWGNDRRGSKPSRKAKRERMKRRMAQNQRHAPQRKTKRKNPCCTENGKMSDAMNCWASVGVLVLIFGAILLFVFVPRSEEEKPSDDAGKLFPRPDCTRYNDQASTIQSASLH